MTVEEKEEKVVGLGETLVTLELLESFNRLSELLYTESISVSLSITVVVCGQKMQNYSRGQKVT